jgi:hypothetical protein
MLTEDGVNFFMGEYPEGDFVRWEDVQEAIKDLNLEAMADAARYEDGG